MVDAHHRLTAALVAALFAMSAAAQESSAAASAPQPAAKAPSSPQDLQPSVDTSAPADKSTEQPANGTPPAKEGATAAKKSAAHPSSAPAASADARPKSGAKDRMELDPTQITGNRELPKVLYIVPWKHSDLSDLGGRPANSLLDEVLAPVDRDVFQRENRYYEALQPDAPHAGTPPAGAAAPPVRDEK